MMPLFLIDQKIDATEVSFWTGIVCQGISIGGSILGGWLVTNLKYVTNFFLFLQLICFFFYIFASMHMALLFRSSLCRYIFLCVLCFVIHCQIKDSIHHI